MNAAPLDNRPPALTDARLLHALAVRAADGATVQAVLGTLADHLQVASLVFVAPDAPLPALKRPLIVPLVLDDWFLGDLVVALTPDSDVRAIASRMTIFTPLIALQIAAKTGTLQHHSRNT